MIGVNGIEVTEELSLKFGKASQEDSIRLFKVSIENYEKIVEVASDNVSGDWESDFEKIQDHLVEKIPTYILFRLDSKNNLGYEWVLFSFVPDVARVREKMIYSTTKAKLKQSLGVGRFFIDIHATKKSDITLSSYKKYIMHKQADAPLTQSEMDRKEEEEQGIFVGGSGTGSVANSGIAFPVDDNVAQSLKGLASGSNNYVQVIIDVNQEKVTLGSSGNISISELSSKVPIDEPRFHFYNYAHTHEGSSLNSMLFIYSCPDGSGGTKSAPVKQRMLYSSSKAHIAQVAESLGLKDYTKLEVNKGDELSEEAVNLLLHPPQVEEKKAFSKPTKPGRGPARLNRRN